MNKETIKEAVRLQELIKEKATSLLNDYIDIVKWDCSEREKEENKEYLNFESFDSKSIVFSGENYWGGNTDYFYLEIPTEFLYDDQAWKDLRVKVEKDKKVKLILEEKKKEEEEKLDLEKKREMYEKLKEELGE